MRVHQWLPSITFFMPLSRPKKELERINCLEVWLNGYTYDDARFVTAGAWLSLWKKAAFGLKIGYDDPGRYRDRLRWYVEVGYGRKQRLRYLTRSA